MANTDLSKFDMNFCRGFTASQLRNIYNGEPKEVLDALILELGISDKPKKKTDEAK